MTRFQTGYGFFLTSFFLIASCQTPDRTNVDLRPIDGNIDGGQATDRTVRIPSNQDIDIGSQTGDIDLSDLRTPDLPDYIIDELGRIEIDLGGTRGRIDEQELTSLCTRDNLSPGIDTLCAAIRATAGNTRFWYLEDHYSNSRIWSGVIIGENQALLLNTAGFKPDETRHGSFHMSPTNRYVVHFSVDQFDGYYHTFDLLAGSYFQRVDPLQLSFGTSDESFHFVSCDIIDDPSWNNSGSRLVGIRDEWNNERERRERARAEGDFSELELGPWWVTETRRFNFGVVPLSLSSFISETVAIFSANVDLEFPYFYFDEDGNIDGDFTASGWPFSFLFANNITGSTEGNDPCLQPDEIAALPARRSNTGSTFDGLESIDGKLFYNGIELVNIRTGEPIFGKDPVGVIIDRSAP